MKIVFRALLVKIFGTSKRRDDMQSRHKSNPIDVSALHGKRRSRSVMMSTRRPITSRGSLIMSAALVMSVVTGLGFSITAAGPASASGVAFHTGDLLAGTDNENILHYSASGTLLDTLSSGSAGSQEAGMCFDATGNLYSTNFQGGNMTKFDSSGNALSYPWGGPFHSPESCVVDSLQNVYVGSVDTGELQQYNTSGTLIATWYPQVENRGIDFIALAADQCTMYYTSEGASILRFNVCNGTQDSTFVTGLPSPCYSVEVRQNGEVMVACETEVVRLSSTGTILQTYPLSSLPGATYLFAMNLDPNGTSFWTADYNNGDIYKVDIVTGAVQETFSAGQGIGGLALVGGFGPVGGPLTNSEVLGPRNPSERWSACHRTKYPVDCLNGAFFHDFTDFSVPGRGVALSLTRSYNSLAAASEGIFGYGWTSDYAMSLGVDASGNVTVTQENGSTVLFSALSGGGYSAPPRVEATLLKNADGTYTMTRMGQTIFHFSASGQLLSISDLNGYTTSLAYNASGQLVTVTDPSGRNLTFTYGTNGLVSSVTDPIGRIVAYAYDANGNLTSVTDPLGRVTSFTYDSTHHLLTMTDPNGGVVTNTYNASGQVTSQTDPMGLTTSFAYAGSSLSSAGGSTTITDPHGAVEVENYQYGELTSLTQASGTPSAQTWTYTYDQYSLQVASMTDPNGHVWTYSYDTNGNQTGVLDPLGRSTSSTYNTLDEPLSVTDPAGIVTTFTYDTNGNLLSKTVTGVGGAPVETTSLTYGDSSHPGDVTQVSDPAGHVTNYAYDANGDVASVTTHPTSGVNDTTQATFDAIGRVACTASPNATAAGVICPAAGQPRVADTTTYAYDADSEVTATTDSLGNMTSTAYDANGNATSVTDPLGNVTKTTYDADNRVTAVTQGYGTSAASTTTYVYDLTPGSGTCSSSVAGALYCTTRTDPNGLATTDYVNAAGELIAETQPASGTTSLTYDPAGNLATRTTTAGVATYGYDAANELTAITYSSPATGFPSAANVAYAYNADGERTSMTDGTGTTNYAYDSLGRLSSTTNGEGSAVAYGYDLDNNVTSLTYPGGHAVTRTYDGAGRETSLTDWLGNTTTFAYDANGNLTTTTYPNSTTATYAYNANDQVTAISGAPTSNPASPFATFATPRNADGRVTGETSTGVPAPNSISYGYDPLSRLTTTSSGNYVYDPVGNATGLASGATLTYNATSGTLASLSSGSSTTNFTYDAAGNRTLAGGATTTTYTYDQANRLTKVTATGASGHLVAGGLFHSLAIESNGTVWAWGENNFGQLGNGTTTQGATSAPGQVLSLSGVASVAAGDYHSLALTTSGTVWAWGYNASGQLGNGTTTSSSVPVQVSNLTGAVAVAGGTGHSLALRSDGTVWAWGDNGYGQLGNGTTSSSSVPVQVSNLTGVVSIAAGGDHSLALKSDGTVWAWGYGRKGELGNGSTSNSSTPVEVSNLTGVVAIAAGADHCLAVLSNGTVWAWGYNGSGQLGNGSTRNSSVPVQVSGLTTATAVAAGGDHSMAIASGGSAWAWGDNGYGELGNGTTKSSSTPVQTLNLTNVAAIAAGTDHSLFATGAGLPYAVGNDQYGQLGNGNTSSTSTPVQVNTVTGVQGTRVLGTYTYNGDGLRMSKTTAATTIPFTWNLNAASGVPQVLFDGTTDYVYGPDGLPLEQVAGSSPTYYLHDQLGSTRVLTSSSGTVVATFTYGPYGQLLGSTGTTSTPLGYAGAYTDAETGFLYLVNRYYDPATAQFVSVDPLVDVSGQVYTYVGDNPLNGVDPLGLWCLSFGCIIGDLSAVTGILALVTIPLGPEVSGVFELASIGTGSVAAAVDVAPCIERTNTCSPLQVATDVLALIPAGISTKLELEAGSLAKAAQDLVRSGQLSQLEAEFAGTAGFKRFVAKLLSIDAAGLSATSAVLANASPCQ